MNRPLIVVAVLAVCALGFLIYTGVTYTQASQEAEADRQLWDDSVALRARFLDLRRQLDEADVAATPKGSVDVPATMGELIKECGIDVSQMKVNIARAGGREQSRHSVTLKDVRLDTMGALLDRLKAKYKYLVVRQITLLAIADRPGEFNWTLEISTPEPEKP